MHFTLFSLIVLLLFVSLSLSRSLDIQLPYKHFQDENPDARFNRTDANRDDKLTFNEFLHTELVYEQVQRDEFNDYDNNKDGFISTEEFEKRIAQQVEKTLQQRADYFGKIYIEFDDNFDMKLNEDEVKKILKDRFMVEPRSNFSNIFKAFDKNGDGALDIEEYVLFDEELPLDQMKAMKSDNSTTHTNTSNL